jgi:hypothetical protein
MFIFMGKQNYFRLFAIRSWSILNSVKYFSNGKEYRWKVRGFYAQRSIPIENEI